MAETTLGRLQKQVEQLSKQVVRLQDNLEHQKQEKKKIKKQFDEYKKNVESIIEKAVNQAVAKVTEHYEKIIKEKDQRIFELENRLNINSSNSSLPSSKTPIYQSKICNSRKPTDKSKGGQSGHKKHKLEKFNEEEITEFEEHKILECPKCHSHNLSEIEVKERDETDFEIKIIKKRHKFYEYICEDCKETIKSNIPLRLHAENSYGSNIKTLAITLTNYGFISYNRTRKIICGLTQNEIDPSEGYLIKLQKQASDLLSNFVFDCKERIIKSLLMYWDDTVIKISEKDKACLRVYTNEDIVLYKAHMSKDTEGMDED